jgi:hypothetical protein
MLKIDFLLCQGIKVYCPTYILDAGPPLSSASLDEETSDFKKRGVRTKVSAVSFWLSLSLIPISCYDVQPFSVQCMLISILYIS